MTGEEADAPDERRTKPTPRMNPARSGIFAPQQALLGSLDEASVNHTLNRTEAAHKSPAGITGEIARERITPLA
jgi:hypothetical protein